MKNNTIRLLCTESEELVSISLAMTGVAAGLMFKFGNLVNVAIGEHY